MPGTQSEIEQYANLSEKRQRAVDAFLTALSEADADSLHGVIDEDAPSGLSWMFRKQLQDDADFSITTITSVLQKNPEEIVSRGEERELSFADEYNPTDL